MDTWERHRKAKEILEKTSKEKQIHIRVTDKEKEEIEKNALKMGFRQVSEYLRVLGMCNPIFKIQITDHVGVKETIKVKINSDNKK